MSYMGWREWLMLGICALLVLPWLLGALLVINDLKQRLNRRKK